MPRSKSLTDEESKFVDEYIRDFDYYAAALRVGIPRLQAKKKGKLILQSHAVMVEIAKRVDSMLPQEIATPQRILAGLMREVGSGVFGKDRIAALKTAHEVLKDVKAQKLKEDEAADAAKKRKNGSGVMLVPGGVALSDWEKVARAQQAKLKEKVRE